jgi:hypothetical protein
VQPVCGCDRSTHRNPCFAAAAGTTAEYGGFCSGFECFDDSHCDPWSYCATTPGNCFGLGACSPVPDRRDCPGDVAVVCGCDAGNHRNACWAATLRVSVDHDGWCGVPGCYENEECDPADYCLKPDGECEGQGTCAPRPDPATCADDPPDGVCACGGAGHFDNPCYAAAAGFSVGYRAPSCQSIVTGCSAGDDCGTGNFCDTDLGMCFFGHCGPMPDPASCQAMMLFEPVCACNDLTYDNTCYGNAAGWVPRYYGLCSAPACATDAECSAYPGTFCARPQGVCVGIGVCAQQPSPAACPSPTELGVCGCDYAEYGNRCLAWAAGRNVLHVGECPASPPP